MIMCRALSYEENTLDKSRLKRYYVEGGVSHLIHMTAAHLW